EIRMTLAEEFNNISDHIGSRICLKAEIVADQFKTAPFECHRYSGRDTFPNAFAISSPRIRRRCQGRGRLLLSAIARCGPFGTSFAKSSQTHADVTYLTTFFGFAMCVAAPRASSALSMMVSDSVG